ncbi:MAG: ABC-F family ATP-binding cassette domain-containing protein, partial [Planctomycetes bacterium]|nr:ABC-F family ATP-binding cassette domain-containing protein [Planctomycetota bacterium]
MAALLSIEDGYKAYNGQELLIGASAQFQERQKVGILGRNGTGKSTLLRILLGDEELDGGRVFRHENLRLGYLRQHDPFLPGESVADFLMRDSEQPDWRCAEVANQFAIGEQQLRNGVKDLSGGWQTRVKLAALLLHDPNMLMLDEPTNFLDIRTQILLQHFLQTYKGALILISHDRRFLKASCNVTCELRNGKIAMEPGDVEAYLVRQEERYEQQRRSNMNLQAKRDQLQKFVDSNKASAGTASQARNKAKQIARLDEDMHEIDDGVGPLVKMHVPEVEPRKGTALLSKDLVIGYGDNAIADEINLDIDHGSCVAVVGDNGQGKTTLLRSLAGTLDTLGGNVKWGYGCEVALYAQHVYSSIDDDDTVRSYLQKQAKVGTSTQLVQD